jgi:hypothetical protein
MKIAIIADYNNKTWIWSQNYNLYTWFRRLWVDVDIINLVSPQWFKSVPSYGVNIVSSVFGNPLLSFAYGVFYKFQQSLKKIVLKEKYDMAILWHQWLAYLSKPLSKLGVNFLIVVDDLFPLYEYANSLDCFIYNHLLLAHLGTIKNMVFISNFTKNDYIKYYANLDHKHYKTIPIWIDSIKISNETEKNLINKLKLWTKRIILNVWSEDVRKNIKTFLEVANHYKHNQNILFVRVWKKSKESDLYITNNKLNNILYMSWLSEEELMALYKISTIVLSPSLLEWYGKQIFEWYLYNNFVITTKVSDVESIFNGDKSVFLINNPESLQEYVWAIDTIFKNKLVFHYTTKIQSIEHEAQEYLDFIKTIKK